MMFKRAFVSSSSFEPYCFIFSVFFHQGLKLKQTSNKAVGFYFICHILLSLNTLEMSGFSSSKTASFPNSTNTKGGEKEVRAELNSEVQHVTFQGDPSGRLTR